MYRQSKLIILNTINTQLSSLVPTEMWRVHLEEVIAGIAAYSELLLNGTLREPEILDLSEVSFKQSSQNW